ncbi:hypothetical protein BGX28_002040 [Mortierella sp. GBA30]|nr:hypothetical protein BGX28_002040 [Mortierella sp. GBA30]
MTLTTFFVYVRRISTISLVSTAGPTGSLGDPTLPAFDVKAYTFRKKSRHYVAVKHKNALRIEPIIYLRTSILDSNREVVRNWDYLRFSLGRFRESAIPKKKLSVEEMRSARILDVDISLLSPNNGDRLIEDSCPACVMRMDGERRIMQVLAKNFKMTPMGEPVIDIRKGHAIVCIKLNCYCDHHNEQEGFVVRMQTIPEVVRLGGSVKLRICCEARSKSGPMDPEVEEEDGLTDIDAPVSTGSRSPVGNGRSAQSPSLSIGSESPDLRNRQRPRSSNSSVTASPQSASERLVNSLSVENTVGGRAVARPNFRKIYPLTPSEGTCLGGTRVTIHGAHFDVLQNPIVFFGQIQADLVTISHHDVMECTTPPAEGLKPGIVPVRIASLAHPLSDSVDFMYMAPPDYDFYNLTATSLSYAMANEYPNGDSLAFILNAHGSAGNLGLSQGWTDGATAIGSSSLDMGYAWCAKEDLALDFLRVIQILAPGRVLPAFKSESGHTLLHMAVQCGMTRLAKELLAMGIDHTAVDRNEKSALRFAQLMANDEMVEILSKAKVPPRPMVPRLDPNFPISNMREAVTSLVQRHEAILGHVLAQEQERQKKELHNMHKRSMQVMKRRDRLAISTAGQLFSDGEGDEIMEHISGDSSPSGRSSDESERSSVDESSMHAIDRKRKSGIEPTEDLAAVKRTVLVTDADVKEESSRILDSKRRAYIEDSCARWENSKGAQLFGNTSNLLEMEEMCLWVCESIGTTPFKGSLGSDVAATRPTQPSLAVLALSAAGLHLYTEQPTRALKHWSLVEINRLEHLSKDSRDTLCIDMCGLVRGRDLSGERITVKSADALKIENAVQSAKMHLDRQHRLSAAQERGWMTLRVKMWSALFGADEREVDTVLTDYLELKDEDTLILKPSQDDRGAHSMAMMGAILCTARELENVERLNFAGAKVAEDGWSKPELIKELEKTARARKNIAVWDFSGCGWTPATVRGFFDGLRSNTQEEHHQCCSVVLSGNSFNGGDEVGDLLIELFKNLKELSHLDLTGCDIGLASMEMLVLHMEGLVELRLQGNRSDHRWWQWMDVVLSRNPQLQRCSIGAPVPLTEPQNSLVSLDRLASMSDLIEVDISNSPVTQATLNVLDQYLRAGPLHLKTLALSHCQLSWSQLVPIFRTLCGVNNSTKFTLDVSKNPLFANQAAMQDWIKSVCEARVQVPFGLKMTDMVMGDSTLQQMLEPLEYATCFNELNLKSMYVAQQLLDTGTISYDEARSRTVPQNASVESCRALGRILASNTTLLMLDVSGTVVETATIRDMSNLGSETTVRLGCSVGGFGRHIAVAFPALAHNCILRILAIDYNRVGQDGMIEFYKAMKSNRGIRVLSCDGNDAFTPKGLETIEGIILPSIKNPTDDDNNTVADSKHQEYNSTLSVWTFGREEIMTHIQLMTQDVLQLKAEFNRLEKLQDRSNKEQASEFKFLGSTCLAEARRKWKSAENKRDEYSLRHERIVEAIRENNQRSKETQPSHI